MKEPEKGYESRTQYGPGYWINIKYKSCEAERKDEFSGATDALARISSLPDNWNHDGAQRFSHWLIKRCRSLLKKLPAVPVISPTGSGSIIFEYEIPGEKFLSFELYEDGRTEQYMDNYITGTVITDEISVSRIPERVKDFLEYHTGL